MVDLRNQVGSNGITPHVGNAYYSIRGSVVGFMCPTYDFGNHLSEQDITNAATAIMKSVGGMLLARTRGARMVFFGVVAGTLGGCSM